MVGLVVVPTDRTAVVLASASVMRGSSSVGMLLVLLLRLASAMVLLLCHMGWHLLLLLLRVLDPGLLLLLIVHLSDSTLSQMNLLFKDTRFENPIIFITFKLQKHIQTLVAYII